MFLTASFCLFCHSCSIVYARAFGFCCSRTSSLPSFSSISINRSQSLNVIFDSDFGAISSPLFSLTTYLASYFALSFLSISAYVSSVLWGLTSSFLIQVLQHTGPITSQNNTKLLTTSFRYESRRFVSKAWSFVQYCFFSL